MPAYRIKYECGDKVADVIENEYSSEDLEEIVRSALRRRMESDGVWPYSTNE